MIETCHGVFVANSSNPACEPVSRDVHDFLDYCRMRAEVARAIDVIFASQDQCAVVGFLNGGVGPLTDARALIDSAHPNSVRFVGSAREWATPGKTPQDQFDDVMNCLWRNGKRHFILAEQYVGGGSIDRALKLTREWFRKAPRTAMSFSVMAFAGKTSRPDAEYHNRVLKYQQLGLPIDAHYLFRCRRLLEIDDGAKVFHPIHKKGGKPGEYEFRRLQPSVVFSCANGGASTASARSGDELFGDYVQRVIGSKPAGKPPREFSVWPESIHSMRCEECKELVHRAHSAWTRFIPLLK